MLMMMGLYRSDSKQAHRKGINTPRKDNAPLLQCTHHMCPIRVHWHWTLVAQHPNLNAVTQVFSFDYKPLVPYEAINDTGMFYGMKYYNDLLMEAGPQGSVQSEVLLRKNKNTFTFKHGRAFPGKVYFNGDECLLPPDTYPSLPNSAHVNPIAISMMAFSVLLLIFII
ncbi:hypothetical protein REPUB_Repub08aG0055900 [Reevesia pubescens]